MSVRRARPQSAPAWASTPSYVGVSARPAGLAGFMGQTPSTSGLSSKGIHRQQHALRVASMYSELAGPNYSKREPRVQPTWRDTGAGVISAGSIDNTYMPKPLTNAWGKCRELSNRESQPLKHRQATDLLVVSKRYTRPAPAMSVADMTTVREPYSRPIPLMHPIDPMRTEGGFVRGPNVIPGAQPPPRSPFALLQTTAPTYNVSGPELKVMKQAYVNASASRIPVERAYLPIGGRPQSAYPSQHKFMHKFAGKPGGLSLVAA